MPKTRANPEGTVPTSSSNEESSKKKQKSQQKAGAGRAGPSKKAAKKPAKKQPVLQAPLADEVSFSTKSEENAPISKLEKNGALSFWKTNRAAVEACLKDKVAVEGKKSSWGDVNVPTKDDSMAVALAYFIFILQCFVKPVRKVSFTFWTGITGITMAQGVAALIIVELGKAGYESDQMENLHWLALTAIYIAANGTANGYSELIRQYQTSVSDALSKEQKEMLADVGDRMAYLKRSRQELLDGQRKARAKFKKDMERVDELVSDLSELEDPYKQFTSTMAGTLTQTEKQELFNAFKRKKTSADARGEEIAPFGTVLVRGQEAKRRRSKAKLDEIFRTLTQDTRNWREEAERKKDAGRDILVVYEPEQRMDEESENDEQQYVSGEQEEDEGLFDPVQD